MIDKKLNNIEEKKKQNFKYIKPLNKIFEELEEENNDENLAGTKMSTKVLLKKA
jgi:hypothetical protein